MILYPLQELRGKSSKKQFSFLIESEWSWDCVKIGRIEEIEEVRDVYTGSRRFKIQILSIEKKETKKKWCMEIVGEQRKEIRKVGSIGKRK